MSTEGAVPSVDGIDDKPAEGRRISLPTPTRIDRWGMNPEDRLRVMEACLLLQRRGWKTNFGLMMAMAAIVAGMGLAANSPALVIGAMLIAPLMTPVLGVAASIAMVLGEALIRSVITVVLATLGVIGLGYLVGLLLPGDLMLSGEVLARTSPDIKDLVVAVAAGLAGAYATARPDMSSSLPGVAVAVALVPPLMVVGITAEAGEFGLPGGAGGALILYLTNLAGIITVATIVFVVTGFVPGNRLRELGPRVMLGFTIGALALFALSIPLVRTFRDSSSTATLQQQVSDVVEAWNGTTSNDFDDVEIDIARGTSPLEIDVEVVGFEQPPSEGSLERSLSEALDEPVDVGIRWTQSQGASSETVVFDEAEVRAVVDAWLSERLAESPYELIRFELTDGNLEVAVRSNVEDVAVEELTAALDDALGYHPSVRLNWERYIDVTSAELDAAARTWAADRDLIVRDVSYDGARVSVEVAGAEMPDAENLKAELATIAGPQVSPSEIDVWFIQRVLAVPTPTVAPIPTPDPAHIPWYDR